MNTYVHKNKGKVARFGSNVATFKKVEVPLSRR